MDSNTMVCCSEQTEVVPEIVPLPLYNAEESKLRATLSWLISKAYGQSPPDVLRDPFYRDEQQLLQLKPPLINVLVSSELYCTAAAVIFHDASFISQDHKAILHSLCRYSIQVHDCDDQPVTETVLTQTAPFRTTAHLALIDGLMLAYARELINVDKVVKALKKQMVVQKSEIPSSMEDAALFWINKVCAKVRDKMEKSELYNEQEVPVVPEMDDLYEDICDGACIATLVSFYRPTQLSFKDIAFSDTMSMSDCVHNLWLIKEFCSKYVQTNIFHFTLEDLLYTHESLKANINVFVAELFHEFEKSADAEVSVPSGGAFLGKRIFSRVEIPDLRKSDRDNRFNIRTAKQYGESASTFRAASDSTFTSRMNSVDSLITDRSVDSIKYHPYKGAISEYQEKLTAFDDSAKSKSTRTITFTDISGQKSKSALAAKEKTLNPYSRSETMPASLSKNTPSIIRLQLEEKRRQYEAQRLQMSVDLVNQRQKLSKEAFFQLLGKACSQKNISNKDEHQKSPIKDGVKTLPRDAKTERSTNVSDGSVSGIDLGELTRNMMEMKEQMKRLSFEQERLQKMVHVKEATSPKFSDVESFPTSAPAAATSSSTAVIMPQPQVVYVSSSIPACSQPAVAATVMQPNFIIPNVNPPFLDASGSGSFASFHLHSDGEPPSRLDPSLELTKNFNNWGMTYKMVKGPRKTWDSNVINSGVPRSATSQLQTDQRATAVTAMDNNYTSFNVPSANSFTQRVSASESPAAPRHSTPRVVSGHLPSDSTTGSNVAIDGASPDYASSTTTANAASEATPVSFVLTPEKPTEGRDEKESSPSVGFIIAASDTSRDEEVIRRREQILANAIRRREELESKKAKLEAQNAFRRTAQQKKQEEEEQRRRAKELHRQRVFEEYQRRKAEKEKNDQSSNNSLASTPVGIGSKGIMRLNRGHSQPPIRPKSQVLFNADSYAASPSNTPTWSLNNIDLINSNKTPVFAETCPESSSMEPALKLYVRPSQKSNRSIVCNAIQYSVLAGSVNDETKKKVLEELAKSDSKHFLLLFRDQKCQFRGLYSWDQVSGTVHKLYGSGPKACTEAMMNLMFKYKNLSLLLRKLLNLEIYRYDSGAKQFGYIPTKHLTATIDGFTIKDEYWQKKPVPYSYHR
ncbi:unnamed protein product [Soboliphyme baturini]|uniref:Calponin-homology (CH) domain-containing protein n=1 Tax=Soboliphyme baturini TaxID=241478 RepID=A0A183IFU4_9BILA|nr:unnamed protein product [Soboliphyme baturini]